MAALSRRMAEPISVPSKQNGFFPKVFVWRGQRHDVRAVVSCRTEVRRDWRGKVERHHFRVRTERAEFELTQDLGRDVWQVEEVVSQQ